VHGWPVLVRLAPGDAAQNQQRDDAADRAGPGDRRSGKRQQKVGEAMEFAADDAPTLVIPNCGHFIAEAARRQLPAALIPFLTA
jgi:hypothetical protein